MFDVFKVKAVFNSLCEVNNAISTVDKIYSLTDDDFDVLNDAWSDLIDYRATETEYDTFKSICKDYGLYVKYAVMWFWELIDGEKLRDLKAQKVLEMTSNMIDFYINHAYTNNYIFGYTYNGNICYTVATAEIIPFIVTLEKASRNDGFAIRYKPNSDIKAKLMALNCTVICTQKEFDDMCKNSRYNRGEIFEKIVHEFHGKKWTKDNRKFTNSGDININGIEYQIKFSKATFINEKTIKNMQNMTNINSIRAIADEILAVVEVDNSILYRVNGKVYCLLYGQEFLCETVAEFYELVDSFRDFYYNED